MQAFVDIGCTRHDVNQATIDGHISGVAGVPWIAYNVVVIDVGSDLKGSVLQSLPNILQQLEREKLISKEVEEKLQE